MGKAFEEEFPEAKLNSGSQFILAKKDGWKAALEWALTHKVAITEAKYECEPPIDMIYVNIIEEELESL